MWDILLGVFSCRGAHRCSVHPMQPVPFMSIGTQKLPGNVQVDSRIQMLFLPQDKMEKVPGAVSALIGLAECSRRHIIRGLGLCIPL